MERGEPFHLLYPDIVEGMFLRSVRPATRAALDDAN